MKSIMRVVSIVLGIGLLAAQAADKRDQQLAEVASIREQLKPLRQKAYLDSDVIEARKKLDAAYKEYWDAVRVAMLRLDPSKKELIERDIAIRKDTAAVPPGSRAEDYEKKAAEQKKDSATEKTSE